MHLCDITVTLEFSLKSFTITMISHLCLWHNNVYSMLTFTEYGSESFYLYFMPCVPRNYVLLKVWTTMMKNENIRLYVTSFDVFSGGLCPMVFCIFHGWCNCSGCLCFKFTSILVCSLEMAYISLGM